MIYIIMILNLESQEICPSVVSSINKLIILLGYTFLHYIVGIIIRSSTLLGGGVYTGATQQVRSEELRIHGMLTSNENLTGDWVEDRSSIVNCII